MRWQFIGQHVKFGIGVIGDEFQQGFARYVDVRGRDRFEVPSGKLVIGALPRQVRPNPSHVRCSYEAAIRPCGNDPIRFLVVKVGDPLGNPATLEDWLIKG